MPAKRPMSCALELARAHAIKPNVQYSHVQALAVPAVMGYALCVRRRRHRRRRMVHLFYIIDTVWRARARAELCRARALGKNMRLICINSSCVHACASETARHNGDDVCINWVYFVINRERTHRGRPTVAAAPRYGSITALRWRASGILNIAMHKPTTESKASYLHS